MGKNAIPATSTVKSANKGYERHRRPGRGTCDMARIEPGPATSNMPNRLTMMGRRKAFAHTKLRRIPFRLKPIEASTGPRCESLFRRKTTEKMSNKKIEAESSRSGMVPELDKTRYGS